LVEKNGWYLYTQKGSHRQFVHDFRPGRVTIPGHPSDELKLKTRDSILKQAGIQ